MPRGRDKEGPYYIAEHSQAKKYHYTAKDKVSRTEAKTKATRNGKRLTTIDSKLNGSN